MHLKIISILLILAATLIGGAYPFLKRLKNTSHLNQPLTEAFVRGIFLGVGLVHMLPSSLHVFSVTHHSLIWPLLLAIAVFLVLYWLGKTALYTTHICVITFVILSLHSLLSGIALGLAPNLAMMIILLVALLAHKSAASFAFSVLLSRSRMPMILSIILFLVFAAMVPTGILMGMHVHLSGDVILEALFLAIAAGTFLYLGTMPDTTCGAEQTAKSKYTYLLLILGFVLMCLVKLV